jgi:transcriptional antiterminator RfaH
MWTGNSIDVARWYAIQTKPKQEDRAECNLRAWNVETFAPKIRERRFNMTFGKTTYVTKLLFSRYLFAQFNASDMLHKVSFTRGVQKVIRFGLSPSPVDDEIIELMRSRRDEDGFIRISDELSPGDKVVISNGYLKDFVGIFERKINDQDRVAILLTTICYQGRVMIERDWVRRATQEI